MAAVPIGEQGRKLRKRMAANRAHLFVFMTNRDVPYSRVMAWRIAGGSAPSGTPTVSCQAKRASASRIMMASGEWSSSRMTRAAPSGRFPPASRAEP
jgi:hypothetical protein